MSIQFHAVRIMRLLALTGLLATVLILDLAGQSGPLASPRPDAGSEALLGMLVRKGMLTVAEADDIRTGFARENQAAVTRAVANGKHTERLSVGMRMQVQYAGIDSDTRGAPANPPATNHFLLRRMYLTLKADLRNDWTTVFVYDFAGGGYDDAVLQWKADRAHTVDFGLRKVNVAYEERASSGNLKAIERSGVTRYFVEANNGRRLGAASYRVGAFVDGRSELGSGCGLVYGGAVTTPERNETFSLASSAGDGTSNRPAFWGNAALTGKLARRGTWLAGIGMGFLPDQGGFGVADLGRGHDLRLYSFHVDVSVGEFAVLAEYLLADVAHGRSAGDARPRGYFVQPSVLVTRQVELVARHQWLDTDGRGVTLADVIRSAGTAATMNTFTEWYGGANWYLRGNDLKLQIGAFRGETKSTPVGTPAKARAIGVRSQLQMQF